MSRQAPAQDDSQEPQDGQLRLAATAHDLNQMLGVISGRLGLLLETVQDPLVRGHLAAMATACRDAADLVRRLDGRDIRQLPRICDPAEEAHKAATMILPPGRDPDGPRCLVDILHGQAVGIPGQVLREVLVNLLVNAREAMDGAGTVRISGALDRDRFHIHVADDGPGIDPKVADQIFVAGNTTKAGAGRGLGLAGCRMLLSEYGGGLELVAGTGRGAVFGLDLPVGQGNLPVVEPVEESAGEGLAPQITRGLQVLVVDDEPSMRDMLGDVLPQLGCRVTVVPDAEAALSTFQPGVYQVALLDQTLPGMSGIDLAGLLRKDDSCLAIFLMTGWGNDEVLQTYDRSHIDFTAHKPLEFDKLQRLLMDAAKLQAARKASLENE